MSIQVNNGAAAINWEGVLSKLGDVQKTQDASGKEMFSITMKAGETTSTFNVRIPDDLELPTTIDSSAIDSLLGKISDMNLELSPEQLQSMKAAIEETYAKAADALNKVSTDSKSTKNLMFDLYALMALLVEVSQTQRDAMRSMRQVQNAQIQKAIQDQADQQRAAAMIGLVVGVVCAAVSVIASASMMAGQMKGHADQLQNSKSAGINSADVKVSALKHADTVQHAAENLTKVQNEVGAEISNGVQARIDAKINDPESGNLQTNFNTARQNLADANTKVETAQTELTQKQTVVTEKTQVRDQAQTAYDSKKQELGIDAKQAAYDQAVQAKEQYVNANGDNADPNQIATLDNRISETKTTLDQANASLKPQADTLEAAQRDLTAAQNDVQLKSNALAAAKEDVKTAKTALETASKDYAKTVEGVADEYQTKYEAAMERRANPPEGADKAQLDADVETAFKEMKLARAHQARVIADEGMMSPGDLQDNIKLAKIELQEARSQVTQSVEYKDAERRIQKYVGLAGIVTTIGTALQNMTQNIAALKSAEATRTQAENQEAQEALDQTKDLFNNAQKLIEDIVQLMHAVVQTESQSIRDAIQA